jgi:hypothetical protein
MDSKNTTDKVVYEWSIEQLGKDKQGGFEVKDHRYDCAAEMPDLNIYPLADNEQLCLVREVFDKNDSIEDREVVVVTSQGLPNCFNNKIVIPQRFHTELAKYPLSIHADVARLS